MSGLDRRVQESTDMPRKLAKLSSLVLIVLGLLLVHTLQGYAPQQTSNASQARLPRYEVDRSWQWPPKLPNNWVTGIVTWVAVDRHDHVWVLHRPRQVPVENKDRAAPPVLEFDAAGKFVQAWGGPGAGYDWGDMEHSLSVDHQDNVWLTFHNPLERSWSAPVDRTDDMILKFTSKGKFIRQFGGRDRHPLADGANTDTTSVHLATEAAVYPKTNEVFIADGYGNRRVLVLDAETLAFKRMWGAFGKQPPPTLGRGIKDSNWVNTTDPNGPDVFNSVHAIKVSNDGLIYVGDRSYRRVQVFTVDGKYVGQVFVNPTAKAYRTASGIAFSTDPQQQYLFVADYENGQMHIVDRKALKQIGSFGTLGEKPGEFRGLHTIAADSKGNLWTAETQPKPLGSRVQRLIFKGSS
jgi:DNA-binding beta-propeller fold protein YncE